MIKEKYLKITKKNYRYQNNFTSNSILSYKYIEYNREECVNKYNKKYIYI